MTATTQDTDRTGTEGTAYRVLQELVFPAKCRRQGCRRSQVDRRGTGAGW